MLYLARHGETTANREGVVLGRTDAPLTAVGVSVAGQLGKLLSGCGIRCILTSPLGRARASAEIMAREIGIAPLPVDELIELSCGCWEGMPRGQLLKGRSVIRVSWADRPPGGESCKDAEGRICRASGILRRELDNGPVLVVGHAVVNRVLLKLWIPMDPTMANALTQPHDLVYRLGGGPSVHWLRADGRRGVGWPHP